MNRRDFLQRSIALPLALTAQPERRAHVIVLGAGLAGLSAALELERRGIQVTVIEARTRSGGRVHTLREPFADGLYAEAGAARIQDTHAHTLRYAKRFGLTLDPFFPSSGSRVTCVAGRRFVGPYELAQVPLDFTEDERRRGHMGNLIHYLMRHVESLGNTVSENWPAADLSRFELPIDEFCRRQGASAAYLRMIGLGHDLTGMSTLQFLRESALSASTKQWYKIRGGNDSLPKALASALSENVRYGLPVVRLEQDDTGVRVICQRDGASPTIRGDYAVCTIPPPVLRRIDTAPGWSAGKQAALIGVNALPMARTFLQTRTRYWLAQGSHGWAFTDDPMDVWDYTRDQPGSRGILGAYQSGRPALHASAVPPRERDALIVERMERVHPGLRDQLEATASYSWIADQWSLGASALFDAGQLSEHYQNLRTPEGRIHFAGEHTSPWTGWMNGALESGERAAAEVATRAIG